MLEGSLSEDAGARKMAAYVLGKLGSAEAIPRLKVLLEDPVTDVRWNAAIALASLGDHTGLPVLRSMADRAILSRMALTGEQTEAAMVNALKAISLLRDAESLPLLEKIQRDDPNLRVREAARLAAEAARGAPGTAPRTSTTNVERHAAVLVG